MTRWRTCPPLIVVAAVIVAAGACAREPSTEPLLRYTKGRATLDMYAGTEHETLSLDTVRRAVYQRGEVLSFVMAGTRGRLRVEVTVGRGRGDFSVNGGYIGIVLDARPLRTTEGGACSVKIVRADIEGVHGGVSCIGLGTRRGKGYDISGSFELSV